MEQKAEANGRRETSRALTYRGTTLGPSELSWIEGRAGAKPEETVSAVAAAVCRHFGWLRPNGEPAVGSCTVFLRRLERGGLVRLPRAPREGRRRTQGADEAEILRMLGPAAPGVVECPPSGPLTVRPIAAEERAGFRLHLERYHPLGFERSVGESLCYAAMVGEELVALLDWGAAVLHNGPRDMWVGWDAATKARRLPWVVNNRRFLMLPWIRQPHLASRVLGATLRRLSRDFEATYGHSVLLAETFVDSARFRGTCYRASNWLYLGETRGFSRVGEGFRQTHQPKSAFVFPLHRRAREWLREGT